MSSTTIIQPIVKNLSLDVPAEKAFAHFTKNIHLWWPLSSHSLSLENASTVVFEASQGGRIYEIDNSGRERVWGRVQLCNPPNHLVFTWVLEDPENQTEVEVRFNDEAEGGSSLTLIHRGWENRADGSAWREKYASGWDGVLAEFRQAV